MPIAKCSCMSGASKSSDVFRKAPPSAMGEENMPVLVRMYLNTSNGALSINFIDCDPIKDQLSTRWDVI